MKNRGSQSELKKTKWRAIGNVNVMQVEDLPAKRQREKRYGVRTSFHLSL